jgi:hypothetical protein
MMLTCMHIYFIAPKCYIFRFVLFFSFLFLAVFSRGANRVSSFYPSILVRFSLR